MCIRVPARVRCVRRGPDDAAAEVAGGERRRAQDADGDGSYMVGLGPHPGVVAVTGTEATTVRAWMKTMCACMHPSFPGTPTHASQPGHPSLCSLCSELTPTVWRWSLACGAREME
jgi:hypothetical protein